MLRRKEEVIIGYQPLFLSEKNVRIYVPMKLARSFSAVRRTIDIREADKINEAARSPLVDSPSLLS
jgi:hypothetical protein